MGKRIRFIASSSKEIYSGTLKQSLHTLFTYSVDKCNLLFWFVMGLCKTRTARSLDQQKCKLYGMYNSGKTCTRHASISGTMRAALIEVSLSICCACTYMY